MGTDRSLPGPLDFGMHYPWTCSASAVECRDHIIVEYREYYYHVIMYRV